MPSYYAAADMGYELSRPLQLMVPVLAVSVEQAHLRYRRTYMAEYFLFEADWGGNRPALQHDGFFYFVLNIHASVTSFPDAKFQIARFLRSCSSPLFNLDFTVPVGIPNNSATSA